jgi:hypothetical protein
MPLLRLHTRGIKKRATGGGESEPRDQRWAGGHSYHHMQPTVEDITDGHAERVALDRQFDVGHVRRHSLLSTNLANNGPPIPEDA